MNATARARLFAAEERLHQLIALSLLMVNQYVIIPDMFGSSIMKMTNNTAAEIAKLTDEQLLDVIDRFRECFTIVHDGQLQKD